MGIPSYFSHFVRQHRRIIKQISKYPKQISFLAFLQQVLQALIFSLAAKQVLLSIDRNIFYCRLIFQHTVCKVFFHTSCMFQCHLFRAVCISWLFLFYCKYYTLFNVSVFINLFYYFVKKPPKLL